jgi:hypothetical protein
MTARVNCCYKLMLGESHGVNCELLVLLTFAFGNPHTFGIWCMYDSFDSGPISDQMRLTRLELYDCDTLAPGCDFTFSASF